MHLAHPALVHFSVAFLVVGGGCEAWGLVRKRESLAAFGARLVIIGWLTLLPAILSGYIAANSLDVSPAARPVLDAHERNGWIVLGMFGLALFWKGWSQGRLPERHLPFYALWLLLSVALIVYSSLLGGEMVYQYGVGVAS